VSTLVLEPIGGIAGDMTIAALTAPRSAARGARRRPAAARVVGRLGGGREVEVQGIRACTSMCAEPGPPCPPAVARHPGPDRAARLPPRAAELAQSGFTLLAKAEARIHGRRPEDVEFHEVARSTRSWTWSARRCCWTRSRPSAIVPPFLASGGGLEQSAHGTIRSPRRRRWSCCGGDGPAQRPGERTIATGAAILSRLDRGTLAIPELSVDRIGYGAGTRRWEDAPNLLRAVLGARRRRAIARDRGS